MRRLDAFVMLYSTLTAMFTATLSLLGEGRPDAYVALAILSYYVSLALTSPSARPRSLQAAVNASLLAVFALIVAYRVYEVLSG